MTGRRRRCRSPRSGSQARRRKGLRHAGELTGCCYRDRALQWAGWWGDGRPQRVSSSAVTVRQAATRMTFLRTYWPSSVGTPWCTLSGQQRERGEDTGHVREEQGQSGPEQQAGDQGESDQGLRGAQQRHGHGCGGSAAGELRHGGGRDLLGRAPGGEELEHPEPAVDDTDTDAQHRDAARPVVLGRTLCGRPAGRGGAHGGKEQVAQQAAGVAGQERGGVGGGHGASGRRPSRRGGRAGEGRGGEGARGVRLAGPVCVEPVQPRPAGIS
ncbi:hypothetical protein SGLAM104S_09384 [Streptomyces glaucescens]